MKFHELQEAFKLTKSGLIDNIIKNLDRDVTNLKIYFDDFSIEVQKTDTLVNDLQNLIIDNLVAIEPNDISIKRENFDEKVLYLRFNQSNISFQIATYMLDDDIFVVDISRYNIINNVSVYKQFNIGEKITSNILNDMWNKILLDVLKFLKDKQENA